MTDYLPRIIDSVLDELIAALPAIAIQGPKAVGKTETAGRRARTTLRLDNPLDVDLLAADPAVLQKLPRPVLLDEWQRRPTIWDEVRRLVDDGARPGSYLLTGSAYPATAEIHSGAGRIDSLRMRPLSLAERFPGTASVSVADLLKGSTDALSGETPLTADDYTHEILSSGFPGIRELSGRALRVRLDGYIDNIVQREFPDQGMHVRRPETLRSWLRAYAKATSTTSSYATILAGATLPGESQPAKTTTIAYRDILSQLWLLDAVEAWHPSDSSVARLAKSPKHQLADPALAARLLGITEEDFAPGRVGNAMIGPLFEHLVTMGVQTYAMAAEARVSHLRTDRGEHEVDIIVERGDRVVAMEVKRAQSIGDDDVRHLKWLRGQLGDRLADAIIVTAGPRAYRRSDGIGVVPAALLGP